MKTYGGSGYIDPRNFDLGISWRWVAIFEINIYPIDFYWFYYARNENAVHYVVRKQGFFLMHLLGFLSLELLTSASGLVISHSEIMSSVIHNVAPM
jgi:hypothetical protein